MAPVAVATIQPIDSFIDYLGAREFFLVSSLSTLAGEIVIRNDMRSYT